MHRKRKVFRWNEFGKPTNDVKVSRDDDDDALEEEITDDGFEEEGASDDDDDDVDEEYIVLTSFMITGIKISKSQIITVDLIKSLP